MTPEELLKRYDIDCKWRTAWTRKSNKKDWGRLQVTHDRIERKCMLANNRIGVLMKHWDILVGGK
jgi:hypothetical protein